MSRVLRSTFSVLFLAFGSAACLFPFGDHDDGGYDDRECRVDYDCGQSTTCRALRCVNDRCEQVNATQGTEATDSSTPACRRSVCDGNGGTTLVVDATMTPKDVPNDCRRSRCEADGTLGGSFDATDVPEDTPGDCMRDQCSETGVDSRVPDDRDVPATGICNSYTCSSGVVQSTPINPTARCSDAGYVCGADGKCGTCPTPDAACTDPGFGSRVQSAAHDFEGIGRTDSGGRTFCGAVPAGEAAYYTYYDNVTGFLAEFDPVFELRPQDDAKMCVFFDCPSITCPANTTSDTLSGHPGCCWDAPAGSFSARHIDFCERGRVTIRVTSEAACTGYELHFND